MGNFGWNFFGGNAIFDILERLKLNPLLLNKYSICWMFKALFLPVSWSLSLPDDKVSESVRFVWSQTS